MLESTHLLPARPRRGTHLDGILVPLGTDEYVHGIPAAKRAEHERLLTHSPEVPDLQAAWLLLHYCAAPSFRLND